MPVIYSNNASTTLSSGINDSTTTVPIASASGFPSIGSGEYYFATIANTNNTKIEVVKVTAGTTSLTVTRAQDGTSAQAFDSGDNFQLRVTAATLEAASKTDVNITGGAIAGAAITNDVIDSQHYADGSIDLAHLSADCVDGTKIADDSINSEHYVDASIDTAHIGDDQVTADKLANSINTDIATGVTANTTANAALPKSGGAMTGAITTNSTFDGVDIATRDAVLTTTTTTANAALPKAGGTMTGNTVHGDNVKDTYGDSADLEIYHSGNDSYITDGGTGNLLIKGTNLSLRSASNEDFLVCTTDGSVAVKHNNSTKIETTAAGATVTGTLTADLADNSIDSEHYVDGSIDHVHLAGDIIDGDNIQDDVINSEHIAAGAIDLEHLSSQSVDEDNLYISNAGSNGQFLSKQSGNNGGLTWADAGGAIPSGTVMAFFQSGAPTGWTKVTSQNDKMLRVVSGTGGGTGGSAAVSSPAHNLAAGSHTLSVSEMPSHNHTTAGGAQFARGGSTGNKFYLNNTNGGNSINAINTANMSNTGGGSGHSHNMSGSITTPQYIDVILCSYD